MVDGGRVASNPLIRLKLDYVGARAERTKFRRALSDDELRLLLATTAASRGMLYRTAVETGFRANELRTLTVESLNVDDCMITVHAAYSKRRRTDVQPITRAFATDLARWLVGRQANERMFPDMPRPQALAAYFRKDAASAGIDADGLDFHCLRHSFISRLARADVHPRTAQDLARHSNITLTMSVYTHVGRGQLSAALDRLSDLGETRKSKRAVAS